MSDTVRAALKGLADEVEFGLDLSDECALGGGDDKYVSCTRSTWEWKRLRQALTNARAALAEPVQEGHLDWRDETDQQERADVIASATGSDASREHVESARRQHAARVKGTGRKRPRADREPEPVRVKLLDEIITELGNAQIAKVNKLLWQPDELRDLLRPLLGVGASKEPVQITAEMEERAAGAAWESLRQRTKETYPRTYDAGPYDALDDEVRQHWLDDTRAALQAALSKPPPKGESELTKGISTAGKWIKTQPPRPMP